MLKLGKLFRKATLFVANRKEAKRIIKEKEKEKDFKKYFELTKEAIVGKRTRQTPMPTFVADGSMGSFDSDADGANTPVYFYDFLKEWNNNGNTISGGSIVFTNDSGRVMVGGDSISLGDGVPTTAVSIGLSEDLETMKPKVVVKPKDVYDELEKLPNAVSLKDLDEKITTFRMREKFIRNNSYSKKECIDMLLRLENRKKYDEFKEFFEEFDYTTTEKIHKLLSKYDLVLKSTDLFIPTFPKEAIDVMDRYETKTLELCEKRPVFYVIAENEKFKKEFERNDPILLVQSPFGVYWQILGAWDQEILILEEL